MSSEIFQTFKPKNEILKKYIDSFYFHKADTIINSKKIVFFPNTKNALTIYKNAQKIESSLNPNHIKIVHHKTYNYLFLFGGIQQNAIISEMNGPFDKIGVVFKPLGMNHFIDEIYLGKIVNNSYNFPSIEKKLKHYVDSIYSTNNLEKRLEMIELLFLNQINDHFNEPLLEKAINMIESFNGKLRIKELADKLNIEEKTLLRKFKNHVNCTPKYYSKVFQFRKAISNHIKKQENKSLTDLALKNEYYDQSDFIKSFRKLTGSTPSFFFNHIHDLGNEIYWFK